MTRITMTFDYLCPFARIGAEVVLQAIEAGAPLQADFRAFSLSEVHNDSDTPVWDQADPLPAGVLALQWGLAVRDQFPERFPAAHLALFSARHDQGLDLRSPEAVRGAVAGAGLDPDEVAAVVADARPRKALAADHHWAVTEHGVFGVPTFIAGDRAVFVRLMSRPAGPPDARRTMDRLIDLLVGWPQLNEFKATRIPR